MPRAYVKPHGLIKKELRNRYSERIENKRLHRNKNKGSNAKNTKLGGIAK